MHVLMLAPEPVLEPRGTPISVFQRLTGLSRLGHTVDLVTYHLGRDIDVPGVTVHRIPHVPFVSRIKTGPSWIKLALDVLLVWTAVGLLLRRRYDVVHTHEEAAYLYVVLQPLFRVPHLYDLHSRLPRQMSAAGFCNIGVAIAALERLERIIIRRSDAIITIGADLAEYINSVSPTANHVMIENLPTQDVFTQQPRQEPAAIRRRLPLEGRFIIVYTGNFARYQGVDILLDCVEHLSARRSDVLFLLVGGAARDVENYRAEVRARRLEEFVHLTSAVPPEDVGTYLDLADILVSPRTEGMSVPLKIYSYLQAGKPIVATDLTAHTLVLDNTTSILSQPTGAALAEAIDRLLLDPELRARLGNQARQVAQTRYSVAAYLAKLDGVYQRLWRERVSRPVVAAG
jgi:glycosyltransferase involved in cell wall biosynthesis